MPICRYAPFLHAGNSLRLKLGEGLVPYKRCSGLQPVPIGLGGLLTVGLGCLAQQIHPLENVLQDQPIPARLSSLTALPLFLRLRPPTPPPSLCPTPSSAPFHAAPATFCLRWQQFSFLLWGFAWACCLPA